MAAWRNRIGDPSTVTTREAERGLARRLAAPQRLENDRIGEQDHEQREEHPRSADGPDGGADDGRGGEQGGEKGALDGQVEQFGDESRTHVGGRELEDDALGGDDAAHLRMVRRRHRSGRHALRWDTVWVDIDRFLATNQPAWDRLDKLCRRGAGGMGRLSAADLDELVRLYQRVSTHLSYARTYYGDASLTATLTSLVARAGALVYGTRPRSLRRFGRFFTSTFPAALWEIRWCIGASAALTFVPAVAVGVWLANSPKAIDAVAPAALRQAYLNHDFASYYSSQPSAQFAAQVTTNNIMVAFFAFGGGILLCAVTAFVLITNGANLGEAAGVFAAAGQEGRFFGLVLPHGLLELTSVVIAGGAGLRLGWTVIHPGDRSRSHALATEGRRAVTIVLGLILTFIVAGTIEGFVAGSGLSTAVRVTIGAVVEVAFVAYAVVAGRAAAARGLSGIIDEGDRGWIPAGDGLQPAERLDVEVGVGQA